MGVATAPHTPPYVAPRQGARVGDRHLCARPQPRWGWARWMDVRTQGSGANAATLGFIPLPRWGILDGKRGLYPIAGGPGVGIGIGIAPVELGGHSQFAPSVLVGGSSHQPRGRCGQAALRMGFRSPERATHTSPGGATGTVPPRWTRDHRPTPQPTAYSLQPTPYGPQPAAHTGACFRPGRAVRLWVGVGGGFP
jgi:hypothetical protein